MFDDSESGAERKNVYVRNETVRPFVYPLPVFFFSVYEIFWPYCPGAFSVIALAQWVMPTHSLLIRPCSPYIYHQPHFQSEDSDDNGDDDADEDDDDDDDHVDALNVDDDDDDDNDGFSRLNQRLNSFLQRM